MTGAPGGRDDSLGHADTVGAETWDAQKLEIGAVLAGRYAIERYVASGGMADVYLAHDLTLETRVAVKVLRPTRGAAEALRERFRGEALLARKVTHPNVCRVYDVGTHETGNTPLAFLSMEYIDGETLAERLQRAPRPPIDRVVPLFRQIARGLAAAHEAGVIHRDFKPQNVIITTALISGEASGSRALERAVIADFGLALNDDERRDAAVAGTPIYMSPEQVSGREVTAKSDIYGFGLALFEALTGRRPFAHADRAVEMEARLKQDPPAVATLRADVPSDLARLVARCLLRRPEDRPSAEEIVTILARPSRPSSRSRAVVVGLVAAVLGVGAAFVARAYWFSPQLAPPMPDVPYAWLSTFPASALPRDREAQRELEQGILALRELDAMRANVHLQHAAGRAPRSVAVQAAYAEALSMLDQRAAAASAAAAALAERDVPLSREQKLSIDARLAYAQNDLAEALNLYHALAGYFPESVSHGIAYIDAAIVVGKMEEAGAALRRLRGLPAAARFTAELDFVDSRLAHARSDYRRAVELATASAQKATTEKKPLLAGLAKVWASDAAWSLGEPAEAMKLAVEAEAELLNAGDPFGAARALRQQGIIDAEEHRDLLAYDRLMRASWVFHAAGSTVSEGRTLNSVALVLGQLDRRSEALALYEKASELLLRGGDKKGAAIIYANEATDLLARGELAKAKTFADRAVGIATELGNDEVSGFCLTVLAAIDLAMGDINAALIDEQRAEPATLKGNNMSDYGNTLELGAAIAYERGLFGEARQRLGMALSVRRRLHEPHAIYGAQLGLIDIALAEEDRAAAENGLRALEIPAELGGEVALGRDLRRAELLRLRRDYRRALALFETASAGEVFDSRGHLAVGKARTLAALGDKRAATDELERRRAVAKQRGERVRELAAELELAHLRNDRGAVAAVAAEATSLGLGRLAELARRYYTGTR